MIFKKQTVRSEQSDVQFMNGTITGGGVRLNVHSFCVDGVLIDTGSASLLANFSSFFQDVDFDQVILTHHHEDHTGGANYIEEHFHAPIKMHPLFIEECQKRASYPFYRKLFWGSRKPFFAEALGNRFSSRTTDWHVIETPGHAADHVALLHENNGQLFSGDLYVHPETKVILRDESIPQIIKSIKRLLPYDFGEMFCCHAGYVKDGKKALHRKLDYLINLQGEILYLAEKGLDEREITSRIFPKSYPITFFSFGEWNSKHIIRSVLQDSFINLGHETNKKP